MIIRLHSAYYLMYNFYIVLYHIHKIIVQEKGSRCLQSEMEILALHDTPQIFAEIDQAVLPKCVH